MSHWRLEHRNHHVQSVLAHIWNVNYAHVSHDLSKMCLCQVAKQRQWACRDHWIGDAVCCSGKMANKAQSFVLNEADFHNFEMKNRVTHAHSAGNKSLWMRPHFMFSAHVARRRQWHSFPSSVLGIQIWLTELYPAMSIYVHISVRPNRSNLSSFAGQFWCLWPKYNRQTKWIAPRNNHRIDWAAITRT